MPKVIEICPNKTWQSYDPPKLTISLSGLELFWSFGWDIMTVLRFGHFRTFHPPTSRPNIISGKHCWGIFFFFKIRIHHNKRNLKCWLWPILCPFSHISFFCLPFHTFSAKHAYIQPPKFEHLNIFTLKKI